MAERFIHAIQILEAYSTSSAQKITLERFSGSRGFHEGRPPHDFREGLAGSFLLPEFFVGIQL